MASSVLMRLRATCGPLAKCVTVATPRLQVRSNALDVIHSLCTVFAPDCPAKVTPDGVPLPHAFVLSLLLAHVLPSSAAAVGAPAPALDAARRAPLFPLASKLLVEATRGRCGAAPTNFAPLLRALLGHVTGCGQLESREGRVVDTDLAGCLGLAAVLLCQPGASVQDMLGPVFAGVDGLIRSVGVCVPALALPLHSPACVFACCTSLRYSRLLAYRTPCCLSLSIPHHTVQVDPPSNEHISWYTCRCF